MNDRQDTSAHAVTLSTLLVWSTAVAALAGYAGYRAAMKEVHEQLASRPPVAVLDVARIASTWPVGATPAERVSNGLAVSRKHAQELAAAGYLVIEDRNVLAAPAQLTVKEP